MKIVTTEMVKRLVFGRHLNAFSPAAKYENARVGEILKRLDEIEHEQEILLKELAGIED